MTAPAIILASASASRARLLRNAGIAFEAIPANVDETGIKAALRVQNATALQCAETLAERKAVSVSQANPDRLVIGADQMLDCDGRWFDKPGSLAEAREHLRALSAKTYLLPTAAVVALNGARIWHFLATPRLTVRALDEVFIAHYLERVGDSALTSVGAYQLEGLGVQMFRAVEGDFFTILGLPLIPLLAFLRDRRAV